MFMFRHTCIHTNGTDEYVYNNIQVWMNDIRKYTEGTKPPRIVMRFNPDSDKTTPPDLQMITSFTGVVEPELLQIDRVAEPV